MCSRIASLITRAYKVQTAILTVHKQYKATNLDDVPDAFGDVKKFKILFEF